MGRRLTYVRMGRRRNYVRIGRRSGERIRIENIERRVLNVFGIVQTVQSSIDIRKRRITIRGSVDIFIQDAGKNNRCVTARLRGDNQV
jgi:hypothetical protein